MAPHKLTGKDLVVLLLSFAVLIIHLLRGEFSAITTPLLAAIFIGLYFRCRTFFQLKSYNGTYVVFKPGFERVTDRKNQVHFSALNILCTQQTLYLNQESKRGGKWESLVTVSVLNPFISTGIYRYTKTGRGAKNKPRGGRKGDWGVHKIHLNPHEKIIHVTAMGKINENEAQFLLVKESSPIVAADDYLTNLKDALEKKDVQILQSKKSKEIDWELVPFRIRERCEKIKRDIKEELRSEL